MAIKFESSPGSAYEVAVGITAKEAAEAGLVVVEWAYSTNPPGPIYGRYKDAPKGHALGITVDDTGGTKVVGAGGPPVTPASAGGDKGSLVNPNDPVIHGGTGDESVHADNAEPLVRDLKAEEAEQREIAEASIEAAGKGKK